MAVIVTFSPNFHQVLMLAFSKLVLGKQLLKTARFQLVNNTKYTFRINSSCDNISWAATKAGTENVGSPLCFSANLKSSYTVPFISKKLCHISDWLEELKSR